MSAPTIAAALRLDHIVSECGYTRSERLWIEERAALYAHQGNRQLWDSADVDHAVRQYERHPWRLDPEYADVDTDGQLAIGVAGEQRAIPGLAKPRTILGVASPLADLH